MKTKNKIIYEIVMTGISMDDTNDRYTKLIT